MERVFPEKNPSLWNEINLVSIEKIEHKQEDYCIGLSQSFGNRLVVTVHGSGTWQTESDHGVRFRKHFPSRSREHTRIADDVLHLVEPSRVLINQLPLYSSDKRRREFQLRSQFCWRHFSLSLSCFIVTTRFFFYIFQQTLNVLLSTAIYRRELISARTAHERHFLACG